MEKDYIYNMIPRSKTSKIVEVLSYFPVVGIVGPRQVGKTTLAKLISKRIKKNTVYIDLENPKDFAKLTDPVLFFENNIDNCVILDEIQLKRELFPVLRAMIDMKREPTRFIILGSASPELIRDSSESLAGRIAYEELPPFNLLEVGGDISNHWLAGGFPDSYLAPTQQLRVKWLSNFVQTYIERDLPLLGLNADRITLRKLWVMLAHMHGAVLNMNNLARSLELSSTTIKKYISFLDNAYLVRQLQPYSGNIKKRLVKSPKVYIRDSGIYHFLLSINDFNSLEYNPIVGASWEGYVIEQITQLLSEDTECYFYRTHLGAECDLVIVKGGKPLMSIEIKYTSVPKLTKGNRIAFSDIGAEMNYVITYNTDDYMIDKNVSVCSLASFLNRIKNHQVF